MSEPEKNPLELPLELIESLPDKIVTYYDFIENATNIGLSKNQKDLFTILDNLIEEVKNAYPQALCKDKCSSCCETFGLPRTTAIEWQLVHKYMVNEMSEEQRQLIIERTIELFSSQISQLSKKITRILLSSILQKMLYNSQMAQS